MPENGITVLVPLGEHPDPRFGINPIKYSLESAERYVAATLRQITRSCRRYRKLTFSTVYFGGCDPSCLTLEQLYQILKALYDHLSIAPVEQTLITYPGTVDAYKAKVLKELSFDHITIRVINDHLPIEDFNTFRNAGFDSIGFEICPPDSKTLLPKTLQELIRLEPDHLHLLSPICPELTPLIPSVFVQFLPGHYAQPGKETRHLINLNSAATFGVQL
jgi:hypothetical protein